jgi:hypothetical protein
LHRPAALRFIPESSQEGARTAEKETILDPDNILFGSDNKQLQSCVVK